jgi:hypothetical protein
MVTCVASTCCSSSSSAAGASTSPAARRTHQGAWVHQQARNLSLTNLLERKPFLIHDRDSKFTVAFHELFCSEGITVIHTPVRAPQANAYARPPAMSTAAIPSAASSTSTTEPQPE